MHVCVYMFLSLYQEFNPDRRSWLILYTLPESTEQPTTAWTSDDAASCSLTFSPLCCCWWEKVGWCQQRTRITSSGTGYDIILPVVAWRTAENSYAWISSSLARYKIHIFWVKANSWCLYNFCWRNYFLRILIHRYQISDFVRNLPGRCLLLLLYYVIHWGRMNIDDVIHVLI